MEAVFYRNYPIPAEKDFALHVVMLHGSLNKV
jgi:hypothetical protein